MQQQPPIISLTLFVDEATCSEDRAECNSNYKRSRSLFVTIRQRVYNCAKIQACELTKIDMSQLEEKVTVVAVKLAKAVKTGQDLQLLNMKKEDVAVNQQHQQNYQKQVKVCCCASCLP